MFKKESWVINMILLIYFLKNIINDIRFENEVLADTASRKNDKEESGGLSEMSLLW